MKEATARLAQPARGHDDWSIKVPLRCRCELCGILSRFLAAADKTRLEYGFMRVRCELCHHEKLVAFSCKRRGFCPSCGARRMAESAALLIDQVLPPLPLRQWVLTLPIPLRLLCATDSRALSESLRIVYRCLWVKQDACNSGKGTSAEREELTPAA